MDVPALKVWRGTLLAIVAAECVIQAAAAYWQGSFRPGEAQGVYGSISHSLTAMTVLAGVTLAALWRFLGPRGSLAAGVVALAGMKVVAQTFQAVFAVHHQDFYQGGALLAGVVVGEAYARVLGLQPLRSHAEAWETRRFGMTGALGMLAGSYMAAGASKVIHGGLEWATSSAIRLMILSHNEVDGTGWSATIPHWVAAHPEVCMALEVGTLVVQLGAFTLILGPRLRRLWAVLLLGFHTGIYVTSYIFFLSPMLFAAAVAVPWGQLLPARMADGEDRGEGARDAQLPAARVGTLLLILFSLVALLRLLSGW